MKKIKLIITISILTIILGISSLSYFLIKPQILLDGEKEIVLKVGETYQEDGAQTRIFDKEISKKYTKKGSIDTNTIGEYTIEYTTDIPYLFNKDSVKRTIHVIDSEAPSIKLKESDITMYLGDEYREPGFNAIDSYDGNLTDKVEITNNINEKLPGTYTIDYKVTDSSGNTTIEKRKVTIKERETTTTKKTVNTNITKKTTNKVNTKAKGVAILMYHYFYDKDAGESGKNSNYMEIHAFEEQMKYLHDNNYYFPSWQEIADYVDGKITLPAKSIVVTIDDGQYTFFNLALPILNKYNITATPFIITNKAGGKKVAKYQYPNINYQSHTHAMHTGGCSGGRGGLFRCIDHDKGVADLKKSIEIVGHNDAIAYPFGDVTDNVLSITKDAGFKVGVTIKYGKAKPGMDRYQLPRIRMYKGMSLSAFKNSI